MRTIAKLSCLAIAVSSALLPFTISSASESSAQKPPAAEVPGAMTFTTQLTLATGTYGVGQPSAMKVSDALEAQNVAAQLFTSIRERTLSTYVSSGIELDGAGRETGRYWVNFTEQPPKWVRKELDGRTFQTAVTWGFNASAARLSELTQQLSEQLAKDPDVVHYDVGPTEALGASGIDIKLVPNGDLDPQALAADAVSAANAAAAAQGGNMRAMAAVAVPVVYAGASDVGLTFQTDIKGGYSTSGCTLGFTANYGGQAGVITASHCDSPDGYWPYENQGSFVIGAPTLDALGQQWDVQFNPRFSDAHTVGRSFKSSASGTITDVTAVVDPQPNQSLCKYGKVTDRDCGQTNPLRVAERDRCAGFSFQGQSFVYTVCHAYRMSRAVTTYGDSGGPWFAGTGAYGITIGADNTSSWFTGTWVAQQLGLYFRR